MKKLIVIKYGGSAMSGREAMEAFAFDAAHLQKRGFSVVIVHGGSLGIQKLLKKLNIESRFVDGLRYTDEAVMEAVQMVLCGKINKDIAALIQGYGGRAVGLCGIDCGIIKAVCKEGSKLGLAGSIESVDTAIITELLSSGIIPVISPVALGIEKGKGRALNVNADTAASRIAGALGPAEFVILSDVRGILREAGNEESLIREISAQEIEVLKSSGVITGGMIPKTDGCLEALRLGVRKVRIVDGRVPGILTKVFLEGLESGTLIG